VHLLRGFPGTHEHPAADIGSSAILESFVACEAGVAEETRTRGFASPALAGFALVDGAFLTELQILHRRQGVKRPPANPACTACRREGSSKASARNDCVPRWPRARGRV